MPNHEIKTIVAELQSMSPRTQLEIVRLCKKIAELTPDYIDTLSEETKEELQPLIDANTELINQAVENRKAIVDNVNNIIEGVSVNENKLKSSGTSEFAGVYVNDMLTSVTNENEVEMTTPAFTFNADTQKAEMKSLLNDESVKIENHEITITNNSHVLKLDANGNLTLDGVAIGSGGGGTLYEHNMSILYSGSRVKFSIINNVGTAYTTIAQIATYLNSKGINIVGNQHVATGIFKTNQQEICVVGGVFATNDTELSIYYTNITSYGSTSISITTSTVVNDTFYTIN